MGKQCFASHVLCFILVEHRFINVFEEIDGFLMDRDLDT